MAKAGHGRAETGAGDAFPTPLSRTIRPLGTGTMAVAEVGAEDVSNLGAVPQDLSAEMLERTTRIERTNTDNTAPAPLPPLPAPVTGVEPWLAPEQLNAGSVPDLGALAGDSTSLSAVYHMTDPGRVSSGRISGRISEQVIMAALASGRVGFLQTYPWLFSLLLGATCLTVGMVLGALIFGNF